MIWHITHRCHKREFLLKFRKDKDAWLDWMYAAKLKFGLRILDFIITSNHVHLLVHDEGNGPDQAISKSLQLAAGRVAQEFNVRKARSGAFWEDRYHATAIETGEYLVNCLVYIDLNMVRAGVVNHPREWRFGGYSELLQPRLRFRKQLTDWRVLARLVGARDLRELQKVRDSWIEIAIKRSDLKRDPRWTESPAVGSDGFLMTIAEEFEERRERSRPAQDEDNALPLTTKEDVAP